tara:strand:+ start:1192 stop:1575 length:384 start_codon:yes stop_codon:yes gene_type:complete
VTARVRCLACEREVAVLTSNRLARHSRSGFRGNGYESWPCEGAGTDAALPLAVERARVAPMRADALRDTIARREAARAAEVALRMSLAQQQVDAYDTATQRERDALAAQEREIADADAALAALRGAT